jgi:hypothetical protein
MWKPVANLTVVVAGVFLLASCVTNDDPGPEPQQDQIPLTDWVEAMINDEEAPDTVDDKPAIVLNVEDQAPFEKYFGR